MSWVKVSERCWERPDESLENYFAFLESLGRSLGNGREHYNIFSKIKFRTDLEVVEPALRYAWKQLRYEQPEIAIVQHDARKTYEVPTDTALQEWLDSTFIVSAASNADELYQSLGAFKQPTLFYLPKSSELAFRGKHCMIDGVGTLMLWDCYFKALAAPMVDIKFGEEPARLAPSLDDVLGYPEEPQDGLGRVLFEGYLASLPGIGPISKVGAVPPRRCEMKELVLSAPMTKAIIEGCKTKGISVTSGLHAAYVHSIIKYADPSYKHLSYATVGQFDLRRYLPQPYNTPEYAVSLSFIPGPITIALPCSFDESARVLNDTYKSFIGKDPEAFLKVRGQYSRTLNEMIQTPEYLAAPIPRDALVSSLGIVEQYIKHDYGRFSVQDVQFGIDVVLGMSMLHFYTFRDQLRLVYSFNDSYEKPSDIQMYLEEMKDILQRELV